jgi:hypothetical protein
MLNLNDLAQRISEIRSGQPLAAAHRDPSVEGVAQALARAHARDEALMASLEGDPRFMAGDLVEIVSPHTMDVVMLGSVGSDEEEDPTVDAGTLCIVQGQYTNDLVTSQTAYVVLLSLSGAAPKEYWLYAKEMRLVSR